MKAIQDLIEISQFYGPDKSYVIAGGGNTSYKNEYKIWIKASGTSLATIQEEGFAVLDREKLNRISTRTYSMNPAEREEEVKKDLEEATLTPGVRPSVETSMHNAINYSFVVHLHPTLVNGLMCANDAENKLKQLFGDDALFIPYTDPGYVLFKKVESSISDYHQKYNKDAAIIWLQNHGIFVGAETIGEIKTIYASIIEKLTSALTEQIPAEGQIPSPLAASVVPAIRMMVSKSGLKTVKVRNNQLIRFYNNKDQSQQITQPFIPDQIVYCKSKWIIIYADEVDLILKEAAEKIESFCSLNVYTPKVILVPGVGLLAVGDNAAQCDIILDVFEDALKIAYYARSFGSAHPMQQNQVEFIENWEVENYRRQVAAGTSSGRAENKTIIVTGAAQGFGEGIARCLLIEGANIVVADLNEEIALQTIQAFNRLTKSNRAIFVKTNVAEIASLENLVTETVLTFGGIDCFISNAGVLRAGGLEEMNPESFAFVTNINYNAYFYCTKVISQVMKLQTSYAPDYYADIIQINSKSGLRGSKANFAYAGGKFGGIGLTQSFALELAPYRIKVNAICPGNFYDGPLWSDPENGLFVQYLKAGKVPGAKTIEDVKDFYLSQVPMKKGCSPEDVTKGVLYLMEQTGETGQALPITGGQVMLS